MCLNVAPNQIALYIYTCFSFSWILNQNVPEQDAKRNLIPHLRALLSSRASSAAIALRAELRLARHYGGIKKNIQNFNQL
jgi:hypothetical protein